MGVETFGRHLHLVVGLKRKRGGGMWYSQRHCTLALVGIETRRPFDCHVAVSDVAPGSGSGVLVLRNKGGDGLWVVVVGTHGMDLGVEVDDDISCRRLGVFVAWEA